MAWWRPLRQRRLEPELMDQPDLAEDHHQQALRGLARINAWSVHTSYVRFLHRLQLIIGVASLVAESIGRQGMREVQDQLGELVTYAELLRLALRGAEADACETPGGLLAPASCRASGIFAAQISGRILEILRNIGTSGILMQPSEADLANEELRPLLDRYMRGRNIGAAEKSRLFRLAWDLTCDSFGMRQELYEYLHAGEGFGSDLKRHSRLGDPGDFEQLI